MEIPADALSPEALRGVIESFVLREGTDYGEQEVSFEQKISQVMSQLKRGEAVVVYDQETESCSIMIR